MPLHIHDLSKATMAASLGGYNLSKAVQLPDAYGGTTFSMTQVKQAPATSTDHPLAGRSPPKARYGPKSKKGRHMMAQAFHEVEEDEPAVVAKTRRKKGGAAAKRQKTAIALSKARRAGVRIPKKG